MKLHVNLLLIDNTARKHLYCNWESLCRKGSQFNKAVERFQARLK